MIISKVKRSLHWLVLGLIVLTMMSPVAPEVLANHQAQCTVPAAERLYGRNVNCGYFLNEYYAGSGEGLLTNIGSPWGNAMLGVNNINAFVGVIRHHLQAGCNPGGGPLDNQRRNAAAFIVLTMQGAPAGTPANAPCSGPYHVNNWENLVRQYDAAGLIEYNGQGWYTRNTRIQGILPDPAWYVDPDCQAFGICVDPSIIVRAPAGNVLYMIKKDCANPIGIPGRLTPLERPPNVSCGTISVNPASPEPGEQFRVTASFTTSGGTGPPVGYAIWLTLPAAGLNDTAIELSTVSRNGTGTGTSPPVSIPNPGVYGGSFRVFVAGGNPENITCPFGVGLPIPPVIIASQPYHQTYGGDTRAGSGFVNDAGTCTTDTEAAFLGFNRAGTPNYTGAGSQLAAFAFGWIVDFASGQLRTNATQPKPLTFANTNPSRSNLGATPFGGGLMDGQAVCAPNFYNEGVEDAETTLGGTTAANIGPGIYERGSPGSPANLTITGGNLGLGTDSRTIYVYGDVTITNNITYAGGNYNDIDHIPGFRLIVRGNIYVAPGVSQLDGIYIAQPRTDGSRGRFYTCAPDGAPPDVGELNGVCRSTKLTVYGAVLADLIKLTRSANTLNTSANNPAHTPAQAAAASTAAEVFMMTPEVWLTSDFTGGGEFNSVNTLPPVL